MKTSMTSYEPRPLKTQNIDGKMNCLWFILPIRLHPFVCLKYTLDFDIYVNAVFAFYGLSLAFWQSKDKKNADTFDAWWGVYGNTGGFGVFFGLLHCVCWIVACLMSKYLIYYLKQAKNLKCRLIHYVMTRQIVIGTHILM